MADEITVYLDHLIRRENLRYQRPAQTGESLDERPNYLLLNELRKDRTRSGKLRKPDFQRATSAWEPADCCSLLETIVNKQIVPSIIMWQNQDNLLDYILDGAHRVSVVMAWFNNDWGESAIRSEDFLGTDEDREKIYKAAQQVRQLVNATVGDIKDYEAAQVEFDRIVEAGASPREKMAIRDFDRARFYTRLERGSIQFPVLWVLGDYRNAEASFLKINKSGKQLYEWERILVENRDSSFARIIMSVAFPATAKRYWPEKAEDGIDDDLLKERVETILSKVAKIHSALLTPVLRQPLRSAHQPLLAPPAIEKKPFWVGEFLTVVEGRKGTLAETTNLLARDKSDSADVITRNANQLLDHAVLAVDHISGESSRSLQLVPTIYFYSEGGAPLRGFLYGWLYWLLSGSDSDVNLRKKIFSALRKPFEETLLEQKKDLTTRFGRGIGSGSEITGQWASFLDELLLLLAKCKGDIKSSDFSIGYSKIRQALPNPKATRNDSDEVAARAFTSKQKSGLTLDRIHQGLTTCSICGGFLDPTQYAQHDHILDYADGGVTSSDNQAIAHPYCNNNKKEIMVMMQAGAPRIPVFEPYDPTLGGQQLTFELFSDGYFSS